MSIHLTPTELAREAGLERWEVLEKCVELGIPVFHGCIDKSLFLASMREPSASPGRITSGRPAPGSLADSSPAPTATTAA
jgi:hypothetical protein